MTAEFRTRDRCELVTHAIDVAGGLSAGTMDFLQELAEAKAASSPAYLRRAAAIAYQKRWSKMIAVTGGGKAGPQTDVVKKLGVAAEKTDEELFMKAVRLWERSGLVPVKGL